MKKMIKMETNTLIMERVGNDLSIKLKHPLGQCNVIAFGMDALEHVHKLPFEFTFIQYLAKSEIVLLKAEQRFDGMKTVVKGFYNENIHQKLQNDTPGIPLNSRVEILHDHYGRQWVKTGTVLSYSKVGRLYLVQIDNINNLLIHDGFYADQLKVIESPG